LFPLGHCKGVKRVAEHLFRFSCFRAGPTLRAGKFKKKKKVFGGGSGKKHKKKKKTPKTKKKQKQKKKKKPRFIVQKIAPKKTKPFPHQGGGSR